MPNPDDLSNRLPDDRRARHYRALCRTLAEAARKAQRHIEEADPGGDSPDCAKAFDVLSDGIAQARAAGVLKE